MIYNKGLSLRISDLYLELTNKTLNFVLLLTLLTLLLFGSDYWYVKIPTGILIMAGILFPNLRFHSFFWFIVFSFVIAGNYKNWYLIDNHKHLLGYWCLAIFCALLSSDSHRVLARTAKLTIGLIFFFAVSWKIISDNFLSGAFFEYSFLFDDRFSFLTTQLGGMTESVKEFNQSALRALTNYDSQLEVVDIRIPPGINLLAKGVTVWAILLESLIAMTFLLPLSSKLSCLRDVFLIVFIASIYPIATVIGFGSILAVMGLVQSTERSFRHAPAGYLFVFFLLQLYRIPWESLLVGE